jgi:DNA-binding NarL/FixJ family response regulator
MKMTQQFNVESALTSYSPTDAIVAVRGRDNGAGPASVGVPDTGTLDKVIVVVDGSALSRECLTKALQTTYASGAIAAFGCVEELLRAELDPDTVSLVLFNAHGKRARDVGVEQALQQIRQNFVEVAVILISDFESGDRVIEALGRGVRGYIPTSASFEVAIKAMRLVEAGGTFVPAASLMNLSDMSSGSANGSHKANGIEGPDFTPRQLGVLHRITEGKANKIIAHELAISESTVKVHVRNIMQKLKATNRTEVAYRTRGMFSHEM